MEHKTRVDLLDLHSLVWRQVSGRIPGDQKLGHLDRRMVVAEQERGESRVPDECNPGVC